MQRLKAAAKRSKWLLTLHMTVTDIWAGRRADGDARDSVSGSTHQQWSRETSIDYIDAVYDDYLHYGSLDSAQLTGKRVLELGPGDNFGVALRFLADGARSVDAVDKFHSVRAPAQQRLIYETMIERLGRPGRARIDDAIALGEDVAFPSDRLNVTEGLAAEELETAFEHGHFDLIVSRAVVEHLYDLDAAFDAMDAVLAPGGLMLHKIDFRDHGMFTDSGMHPLTRLTLPDLLYRRMTRHTGRPNRALSDWYRAKLEGLGYRTRLFATHLVGRDEELIPHPTDFALDPGGDADVIALVEGIRPRLRPEFARLRADDLAVAGVFMVAQKA